MSKPRDLPISVLGIQKDAEGEITETEMEVEGKYAFVSGRHRLFYVDEEIVEGAQVRTMLQFDARQLRLSRKGALFQEFHFAVNERTEAMYSSPYGSLALSFETTRIAAEWTEERGRLELCYRLYIEGRFQSENTLIIITV